MYICMQDVMHTITGNKLLGKGYLQLSIFELKEA